VCFFPGFQNIYIQLRLKPNWLSVQFKNLKFNKNHHTNIKMKITVKNNNDGVGNIYV